MKTSAQLAPRPAAVTPLHGDVLPSDVVSRAPEVSRAALRLAEIPLIGLPVQEPVSKPADKANKKGQGKGKLKSKGKDKAEGLIKTKKKEATKGKAKPEFGSARGVETVFRSSYRTQLDLTALAATKANIMISLNGLILSVLTLSGPFVLVAEPMFTLPIAIFLATCLASITFAVLAARPRLRQARHTPQDFAQDRANVLVFEDFSSLSKEQHTEAMMALLQDNARIYRSMTGQLYELGTMANRKFRMLSISYATFLVGLTLSTLLLLGIGFFNQLPELAELFAQIQIGRMG